MVQGFGNESVSLTVALDGDSTGTAVEAVCVHQKLRLTAAVSGVDEGETVSLVIKDNGTTAYSGDGSTADVVYRESGELSTGAHQFTAIATVRRGSEQQSVSSDPTSLVAYKVSLEGFSTSSTRYLVPGHKNTIKYKIEPADYTASAVALEIVPEGGSASAASVSLGSVAGGSHSYDYNGSGLSSGEYTVKIMADACDDEGSAEVVAFQGSLLFWDFLSDGFSSGIAAGTVTTESLATRVRAFDEESFSGNITVQSTEVAEGEEHYEEGGVEAALTNYTFYAMSDPDQWYIWKFEVQDGGVLDKADNPFDLDPDTEGRQIGIQWKIRIDGDGNISDVSGAEVITAEE